MVEFKGIESATNGREPLVSPKDLETLIALLFVGKSGGRTFGIDDNIGVLFKNLNKNQFWLELLSYFNDNVSKNEHPGVREKNLGTDPTSVVKFIADNIDMKPESFQKLLEYYKSGEQKDSNNYWNESMEQLLKDYLKYFDYENIKKNESPDAETDESNEVVTDSHGSITIKKEDESEDGGTTIQKFRMTDIMNGDAGESFNGPRWVRSWFNIDNETYKKVRDTDPIRQVLDSDRDLQFTVSKKNKNYSSLVEEFEDKCLRLIMPKYLRRVEVEDLNRNFWVIGQTVTGLCAFLFNDENPLSNMLGSIINEVVQLWENVLYLWAELMELNKDKVSESLECFFLPVPNSELMPYVKFDGFDGLGNSNLEEVLGDRFNYLPQSMSDCNVLVVPEIRCDNYFSNYYSKVIYPGMLLYDCNVKKWTLYPFKGHNYIDLKEKVDNGQIIDKYYGIREKGKNYEVKDFSKIQDEQETALYTYLLRSDCDFNVKYTWNVESQSGTLEKKDSGDYMVKLTFTDVIGELINDNGQKSSSFTLGNNGLEDMTLNLDYKDGTFPPKIALDNPNSNGTKTVEIKQGYYQGELLSYYKLINKEIPKLNPEDFPPIETEYKLVAFDWDIKKMGATKEEEAIADKSTVKKILQGLKEAETNKQKEIAFVGGAILCAVALHLFEGESKADFLVPTYIIDKLEDEEEESKNSYCFCPIVIYLPSGTIDTGVDDTSGYNYDWVWLLNKEEVFKDNDVIDYTKVIFNKNFYSGNENEKTFSQCIAKETNNESSGGDTKKIEIGWNKPNEKLKEEITVGTQSKVIADVEDGAISSIEFNLYFLDKNGQYAATSSGPEEEETPSENQALGYCIQAIKAKINTNPEIKAERKIDKHYTKDIADSEGGNTFDDLKDKIIEKLENISDITTDKLNEIFTNGGWSEEGEVT